MSPELMLRPSLSGDALAHWYDEVEGVAGAYAPAFVERTVFDRMCMICGCVAGAYAPAFVERGPRDWGIWAATGGVAGAYAPAFVRRTSALR